MNLMTPKQNQRPGDNSADTWHVHEDETWEWGINCPQCHSGRSFDIQPGPLVGTVPGGHNDSRGDARYDFQKNFDKGLDEYRKARGEGLQPRASTVEAVRDAHLQVRAQKRALKKIKKYGDASTLKVAAGVRT